MLPPLFAETFHDPNHTLYSVDVTVPTYAINSLSLSSDELRIAVPHPHAYFCHEHNGWVILLRGQSTINPLHSRPLEISIPDRILPVSCTGNSGQHLTHHWHKFQRAVRANELNPPLLDTSISLDLYFCCQCSVCCVISDVIPGVLPLGLVESFTNHKLSNPLEGRTPDATALWCWETIITLIERCLWVNEQRMVYVHRSENQQVPPEKDTICEILMLLGFKLTHMINANDGMTLLSPSIDMTTADGRQSRRTLLRAWAETRAWLKIFMKFRNDLGKYRPQIQLGQIGAHSTQIPRDISFIAYRENINESDNPWRILGMSGTASSWKMLEYAYRAQCRCNPSQRAIYFSHLCRIVKTALQTNQVPAYLLSNPPQKSYMSFALLTFDADSTVRMEIDNRPDDDFIAGAMRDERRRSCKTLTEDNDIKSAVLNAQKLIADEGASNMRHSHEMLPSPQHELLETASHLHAPRLPHMSSIHVWSPFPPESLHEEVGFGPESYEASLWASSAPNLLTGSSPGENAPQDAPRSAPQLATQADQNPMFLSYYTASIHPNVTKVSLGNSLSAALGSTVSVPSSSIPTAMGLPTATSYTMLTYTPVLGFDLDHYPALSSTFNFGIDLHGVPAIDTDPLPGCQAVIEGPPTGGAIHRARNSPQNGCSSRFCSVTSPNAVHHSVCGLIDRDSLRSERPTTWRESSFDTPPDPIIAGTRRSQRLPLELCDIMIDNLGNELFTKAPICGLHEFTHYALHCRSLRNCALTCRSWHPRSQRNLIRRITISNSAELAGLMQLLACRPQYRQWIEEIVILIPCYTRAHFDPAEPNWISLISMFANQLQNLRKIQLCSESEEELQRSPSPYRYQDASFWSSVQPFSFVTELIVKTYCSGSRGGLCRLIGSLPRLRTLRFWSSIDCFPGHTDVQEQMNRSEDLDLLEIDVSKCRGDWIDGEEIIYSLFKIWPTALPLKRFHILNEEESWGKDTLRCTYAINRLLRAAGPNLHEVRLDCVVFEDEYDESDDVFLDFSENTCLRSLILLQSDLLDEDRIPMSLHGWIPRVLSNISSSVLENITLTISDRDLDMNAILNRTSEAGIQRVLKKMACDRIDSILSRDHFTTLQSFCIVIDLDANQWYLNQTLEVTYIGAATEEDPQAIDEQGLMKRICQLVRPHLPRLSARGVLRFCSLKDFRERKEY